MKFYAFASAVVLLLSSCRTAPEATSPPDAPRFAVAIHGGAGAIPKTAPKKRVADYEAALGAALDRAAAKLRAGASALDVVEATVRELEDDPRFNAGRGAVFTAEGVHELDASIMNGTTLACGAVTGVTTVRNPVSLARLVMEKTPHVLLSGAGAERFADEMKVERVANAWFDVDDQRTAFEKSKRAATGAAEAALSEEDKALRYGTVGCVARDTSGRLAAATSTGGMSFKKFGRVGDSPIVGAGTYANDATCAVSCTGTGEEFIRHGVAHDVHARMAHGGATLAEAARAVVHDVLKPDDGGLIAVDRDGRVVMERNTSGMFRAALDADGTRVVKIWD
jgi:L-asparaginase / beta-aspartyl-peptidase